ncbi:MAG: hypothetical protein Q8K60_00580, partial [Parachlamydiaceae bacterium]|nr:hypothetical protein [Parachlamydiaceae bacterium]
MTFPNLHSLPPLIPSTDTFSVNSDINNSSNIIENSHENKKNSFILFPFSEADQRRNDFYDKGICDLYGKVTESFKSLPICPSLIDPNIFQPLIKQIQEILTLKRVILNTSLKINEKSSIDVSITTSLEELFQHVNQLSNQNKLFEPVLNTFFKIIDFYLIGSSVLPLLGKETLQAITIHSFGHIFNENQIKEWFHQKTLQHFFSNTGNDLDIRIIISNSRIESVGTLSDIFLNFLCQKIPQKVFSYLQRHSPWEENLNTILSSYLLTSGAIKNRVKVKDDYTTFALIGLNTDSLPIDINCVGSYLNEKTKEIKPTLEFPNLTSLNSMSIPLKQFLNSDSSIKSFSFFSFPFGIQSLLDLLFNCATPTTHNQFGWRHFLRKYNRMLDPNDEKKMVDSVIEFKHKKDFKIISKHKYLPNPADIQTIGGFIYLLLANDFIKVETEAPTDPFILSEYLFKACLSLTTYSEMNDQDCLKLWECVDQYYWKPLNRSAKKESLFHCIKIAILEDRIPFSVLLAYINLLGYLSYPDLATTHCNTPIIDLKVPFSVFLPIRLQSDSETIQRYFEKNLFPSSLQSIHAFFNPPSELSLIDFPLTKYFNQFNVKSSILKNTVEKLIKGKNSTLKLIGLELYLSFYSFSPDTSFLFYDVIFDFPSIFSTTQAQKHLLTIINALHQISQNEFQDAIPIIKKCSLHNLKESNLIEWLNLFVETNSDYSLKLAYLFFQQHRKHFSNHSYEDYWPLFANLTVNNIHRAFSLFHYLQQHSLSFKSNVINFIIPLLTQYQKQPSHIKIQSSLHVFNVLQFLFDQENIVAFKNQEQQINFARLLNVFFQEHSSIKAFENDLDF